MPGPTGGLREKGNKKTATLNSGLLSSQIYDIICLMEDLNRLDYLRDAYRNRHLGAVIEGLGSGITAGITAELIR